MKTLICASCTIAALLALTPIRQAHGQAGFSHKAAAEAAFNEGAKLYAEESYEEACKRFEASQALDKALGTTLRLADCYDRVGKSASAWAAFKEAAAMASAQGQPAREEIASERALELQARLTYLVVDVTPQTAKLEGVSVVLNGNEIPQGTWGTPIPVDPGEQELEATAPDHEPWSHTLTLEAIAGERTMLVPQLVPLPKPEPVAEEPTEQLESHPPIDRAAKARSTQRTVAFAVGGVGLGALALGGLFTYRAYDLNSQSLDYCLSGDSTACTERGKALRDDARSSGNIATIATSAGFALIGGSVILLVTAPKRKRQEQTTRLRVSAATSLAGARLQLGGSW